ncbi:MAG: hypothetical protein F6K09_39965 [Merismopedia sp. SIO2A8]|nr:hypothetical protein [Merismopedia sp. SIO2A8]
MGVVLGTGVFTALSTGAAAIARGNTAGVGYSSRSDVSYCSTSLTANDPNSPINIREGPGTVYNERHYGYAGDWVDILNNNGDPTIYLVFLL